MTSKQAQIIFRVILYANNAHGQYKVMQFLAKRLKKLRCGRVRARQRASHRASAASGRSAAASTKQVSTKKVSPGRRGARGHLLLLRTCRIREFCFCYEENELSREENESQKQREVGGEKSHSEERVQREKEENVQGRGWTGRCGLLPCESDAGRPAFVLTVHI